MVLKSLKNRPHWYVLLNYFTNRPSFKKNVDEKIELPGPWNTYGILPFMGYEQFWLFRNRSFTKMF